MTTLEFMACDDEKWSPPITKDLIYNINGGTRELKNYRHK